MHKHIVTDKNDYDFSETPDLLPSPAFASLELAAAVSFFAALASAALTSFFADSAGSSSLSPRLNGSWSSSSALGSSDIRGCHLPPVLPVAVGGVP
jgi:hypothetical protein